jgi:DNA primase
VSSKTVQGYKQLPKKGKLLVITKSMKDVASMYSFGITAIAPNSETQFITDKMLEELKERFNHIVVFYDNDLPGISNMNKIKKAHPELDYFFIPRKYGCKDFSDLVEKYGRETVKNLIKEWIYGKKVD